MAAYMNEGASEQWNSSNLWRAVFASDPLALSLWPPDSDSWSGCFGCESDQVWVSWGYRAARTEAIFVAF